MALDVGENLFVTTPPSPQNALNIFAGEWSEQFTGILATSQPLTAGTHFFDPRLSWADTTLREFSGTGIAGLSVLELAAHDGAGAAALINLGAREITAVEAKPREYLRSLVAKEVLGLATVRFLLGDGLNYLKDTEIHFDLAVAGGFINQQLDPVEAIALLTRKCSKILLWCPVFDDAAGGTQSGLRVKYGPPRARVFGGFAHTLYPRLEGTLAAGCWMRAEEIVGALRHFGFTRVTSREETGAAGKILSVVGAKESAPSLDSGV